MAEPLAPTDVEATVAALGLSLDIDQLIETLGTANTRGERARRPPARYQKKDGAAAAAAAMPPPPPPPPRATAAAPAGISKRMRVRVRVLKHDQKPSVVGRTLTRMLAPPVPSELKRNTFRCIDDLLNHVQPPREGAPLNLVPGDEVSLCDLYG